jgi:sugar phosphate isomerase/epimerase
MRIKLSKEVSRREFVGSVAALPVVSIAAHAKSSQNKVDRLACNSWPFRAYFDTPHMHEYRKAQYPLLTQAEFPEFLADHFKIHNVEFLPQHFTDIEAGTVAKVKAGLKKANSRCCNLMGVEIPGGVFVKSSDHKAIANEAERWVGVAVALGSPSITVALNGNGPADPKIAADNLTPVVEIAEERGVKVLFHNDSMKTESAEILTAVIGYLGRNKTGTCPDFGNFATKSAAYALAQLRMLAPYASNICHAKDGIADDGKFYADDFPASIKVMKDSGFKGLYSLEFEGLGEPMDGIHKLMEMTEHYLS